MGKTAFKNLLVDSFWAKEFQSWLLPLKWPSLDHFCSVELFLSQGQLGWALLKTKQKTLGIELLIKHGLNFVKRFLAAENWEGFLCWICIKASLVLWASCGSCWEMSWSQTLASHSYSPIFQFGGGLPLKLEVSRSLNNRDQ